MGIVSMLVVDGQNVETRVRPQLRRSAARPAITSIPIRVTDRSEQASPLLLANTGGLLQPRAERMAPHRLLKVFDERLLQRLELGDDAAGGGQFSGSEADEFAFGELEQ